MYCICIKSDFLTGALSGCSLIDLCLRQLSCAQGMFDHTSLVSFNIYIYILEGTARYEGLLLAPAESFGRRPRLFYAVFAYVRPYLVVSSNLFNF